VLITRLSHRSEVIEKQDIIEDQQILRSNKSFSEWGDLFTDQVLATALLDRLLHHSSIINIRGQSYRLKEKRQAGLFQGADTIKESLTS